MLQPWYKYDKWLLIPRLHPAFCCYTQKTKWIAGWSLETGLINFINLSLSNLIGPLKTTMVEAEWRECHSLFIHSLKLCAKICSIFLGLEITSLYWQWTCDQWLTLGVHAHKGFGSLSVCLSDCYQSTDFIRGLHNKMYIYTCQQIFAKR